MQLEIKAIKLCFPLEGTARHFRSNHVILYANRREVDFSEGIRAQLCEDTADLREKIRVLAAKVNVLTREVHRAQQRGHVLEGRLLGREEEFHNLAENLGVGVAGHRPFMKRFETLQRCRFFFIIMTTTRAAFTDQIIENFLYHEN